ncbi:MAG: 4-hydroxy-tetrahydrodipicolinate reductase [Aestuariivirgaceae bacterium]|nr:4-hydroxy-tetrahydrodipicolinate reductase [Aestuariivirgaceae bacterium]
MRLAVAGAGGRMGRTLARIIHETPGVTLGGGLERSGSEFLGRDFGELAGLGPLNVALTDNAPELFTRIDGIIDFTAPAATVELAGLSAQARIVHVIGTTGLSEAQEAAIDAAAAHATIVKSGNMSLGVNLLAALVKRAAASLGEDFDIEIAEIHHRAKVDAPSGTALLLGEAAAAGRDILLKERSVRVRDGHTGARVTGDIGFATLRGGSVVGDHTVMFAGDGERIELIHRAENRDIFARGAVKAAIWASGKKPGRYSMADVLELT